MKMLQIRMKFGSTQGLELEDNLENRNLAFCIKGNDSIIQTYKVRGTQLGRVNITILTEIDPSFPGDCGPEVILNKR